MAPTEILAEQHYLKLTRWLEPLGVKMAWLAGGMKARERKLAVEAIASGETQLAIGTHALFQEGVEFAKLGLAIVDEQHRFGVEQRLALAAKGKTSPEPHQLMMSATPIPRTLSMSYYADLDVTVIEHAERMGLAQLHQLRGRVGRGSKQSLAVLLYYQPLSEAARARLKVIYETHDGFEIARQDLLLRGPGEYLGARQSGAPLLRFADLERDVDLIEAARAVADELIAAKSPAVMRHLDRWLGTRQFYLRA